MNPRNFPEFTLKAHLARLRHMLNFFQGQKGLGQVGQVHVNCFTFDNHVVDICLNPHLPTKHLVNLSLVSGSCVLKSEWHYFVAIRLSVNGKGCVLSVFRGHAYLIVSQESIHEGQQLVVRSGIYQLVDSRERIAILRISFIQVGIINAHRPVTISFLNKYNIG